MSRTMTLPGADGSTSAAQTAAGESRIAPTPRPTTPALIASPASHGHREPLMGG
jgi:hypothetical protein